jgi:diacylglycerol O-acyltransferase
MKPVNAIDSGFLWLEKTNQPMHVGGMQLYTPPADADETFGAKMVEKMRSHKTLYAPFNKRLTRKLGVWFWEDENDFDPEYHVRHLALPKPGRIRELLALVSQLHSNLIDRNRPLWEMYVIDGIEDGRIAIYVKIHHALVDGVAAMRLLQKSLSEDPQERDMVPVWAMPPSKKRSAKKAEPLDGLTALADVLNQQARSLPRVTQEVVRSIRASLSNDPDYVSAFQAPKTLFNTRVTGSRRFAAQDWDLERIKAAGKRHNATLNDVVLAMCASAMRQYLLEQDALPDKPLIGMVPVSLREDDSISGNQVGLLLANLATDEADPIKRLKKIKSSMQHMKERFATMTQTEIMNYVATVLAVNGANMAAGIAPEWQAFNITISNVPGPKKALYYYGAKLEGTYPVSIVLDGQALNITLNSYNGQLEFGVIACRRTVPHMQNILRYLEDGLRELENS